MATVHNEYNRMVSDIYDKVPKAIFAALVVSEYFNRLGIEPEDLSRAVFAEWKLLHTQNIVPQKPPNL